MSAAEEPPVLLSVDETGVALVTLNRPARQNAWTPAMRLHYTAALDRAARDPMVRVIVVTGAGGHFCPGGDGAVLEDIAGGEAGTASTDSNPPWLARAVAKPVIAAIPGACFGIGLAQALCCDIRFAADDAKFSTAFSRRGLAAEMGMSWLLPRAIGASRAADLLFSARIVRADEAERIGLVSRVFPAASLLDETLAYARGIAAQVSPWSLATIKQQLHADLTGSFAEACDRAEAWLGPATTGADFREGVQSWIEKRAPGFAPLAGDRARIAIDIAAGPDPIRPGIR